MKYILPVFQIWKKITVLLESLLYVFKSMFSIGFINKAIMSSIKSHPSIAHVHLNLDERLSNSAYTVKVSGN